MVTCIINSMTHKRKHVVSCRKKSELNAIHGNYRHATFQSCNSELSSLLHVAKDLLNQEVSAIGLHGNIAAESAVEVTTLALKCLAHLFTWVPLTTVISPRLLASIFHFAGLAIPEVSITTVYGPYYL